MKWTMALGCAAAAIALAACGGGDGDEGATAEESAPVAAPMPSTAAGAVDVLLAEMEAIADALESVTDEDSAETAAARIRQAAVRMQAVSDGNPDMQGPAAVTAFMARRDALMQAQNRLAQAAMTLEAENPEAVEIINEAMSEIRMPGQ